MNDIQTLLSERASTIAPPVLDLDAITRAGTRRVRRRRLTAAGGMAVVVTAAVAVPASLLGAGVLGSGDPDSGFAGTDASVVTWSTGNVIHAGDRAIDVGHKVDLFVEVPDGYVFADPERTVWHWTDGEARRVGELATDHGRQLVADGPHVAWVDDNLYTVLDTTDDTYRREGTAEIEPAPEFGGPAVDALDGDHLYVRDARGALRFDLSTRALTVIVPAEDIAPAFRFDDVEGGLVLFSNEVDEPQPDEATYASREVSQPGAPLAVSGGNLSPDGRLVMSENSSTQSDHFTLIEVATGEDLTPAAADAYGFFLGYAWLDNDTYAAFAFKDAEDPRLADLLTCEVAGACTVTTETPLRWPFQLPIGTRIGD